VVIFVIPIVRRFAIAAVICVVLARVVRGISHLTLNKLSSLAGIRGGIGASSGISGDTGGYLLLCIRILLISLRRDWWDHLIHAVRLH